MEPVPWQVPSTAVRACALDRNAPHPWQNAKPGVRDFGSGCRAALRLLAPRDLLGTCLPTPSAILSLKGPIFPYMVRAVPRGGGWGQRSLSRSQLATTP